MGGYTEAQKAAMAELVAAIAADVEAKRGSVVPDSRRPTFLRVIVAKDRFKAALMETAHG